MTNATEDRPDAVAVLMKPTPSAILELAREQLDEKTQGLRITQVLRAPESVPLPVHRSAGLRRHRIGTLTHLATYVGKRVKSGDDGAIGFYTPKQVAVVLGESELSKEHDVVTCDLERSPEFVRWTEACGVKLSQAGLVAFLRANRSAIAEGPGGGMLDVAGLIATFQSLRGELVHDAEEFLDAKSMSVSFTLRRKSRKAAGEEIQVDAVPTEFPVRLAILADDAVPTEFRVLVHVSGAEGAQPIFVLELESLEETVSRHLELRLRSFEASAGFPCVRGDYRMEQPQEQPFPAAVARFMELHAKLVEAATPQG